VVPENQVKSAATYLDRVLKDVVPENQVKSAATYLDRVLKDVVTEDNNKSFDLASFVCLLSEKICTANPFVRCFVLGWIQLLQTVPNMDLLDYLPQLVYGEKHESRKATE
jgi:vacuole morphology and inheritance protein 14